jgi:hypothetical protein
MIESDKEFYQWRIRHYRVAVVCLGIMLALTAVLMPPLARAAYSTQATPTSVHERCHVGYLVYVRDGIILRVRSAPNTNSETLGTIDATANPQSAIVLANGWFQLCSLNDKFISGNPALVTYITTTPTRIVSSTPSPQPSATGTPAKLGKRICIEYDNEQGLQDVCGLFPLNARVVSIEVVTEEPRP